MLWIMIFSTEMSCLENCWGDLKNTVFRHIPNKMLPNVLWEGGRGPVWINGTFEWLFVIPQIGYYFFFNYFRRNWAALLSLPATRTAYRWWVEPALPARPRPTPWRLRRTTSVTRWTRICSWSAWRPVCSWSSCHGTPPSRPCERSCSMLSTVPRTRSVGDQGA